MERYFIVLSMFNMEENIARENIWHYHNYRISARNSSLIEMFVVISGRFPYYVQALFCPHLLSAFLISLWRREQIILMQ